MYYRRILSKKYRFLWGLLLLSVLGCIDPINLTLEDEDEFLVIDGGLTNSVGTHPLTVYYATGQRTSARRAVTDAQIRLIADTGEQWNYTETTDGTYELPMVQGQAGVSYRIAMDLSDGQTYESQLEKMPELIRGANAYWELMERPVLNRNGFPFDRPFVDLYLDTELPVGRDYWLKWDVFTMYAYPEVQCSPLGPPPKICYFTEEPTAQEINLFNGSNFENTSLERLPLTTKDIPTLNSEFRNKFYFLVNQKSITSTAHDYWRRINAITNQTGSVFDAPPAPVVGNVVNPNDESEIVLGFFEVSNVDSLRTFITSQDIRTLYAFPEETCRAGNPLNLFERACCNCQLLPDASLDRPAWW
ncbi:MAG: DUF4249 domain-containing protein [Bacteroidota bacterium]